MNITDWTLTGSDRQTIYGNTHLPKAEPLGIALLAHGFKGYKDYGLFPQLAQAMANAGLIAHRFNFSHSGMTPRFETFERPDLFEKDTWGKQVNDLQHVALSAFSGELLGEGLPQVWFGHSRGGVSVLLAAQRAFADQAKCAVRPAGLITAAAPDEACSLDDEQKAQLQQQGRLASPSGRTGQMLHVGKAWLNEIESNPQAFDPVKAAASAACPQLIMHGQADETVPVSAAQRLANAAGNKATLHLFPQTNHVFNAPNPLPQSHAPTSETALLFDLASAFAKQCVTGG